MSADAYFDEYTVEISEIPARPIVATKLYPPRLRRQMVERSKLVEQLNRDSDRRLTIISAPAGYGKSTLAAQWVRQAGVPFAWINLDSDDNNLSFFFNTVVASLHQIDPQLTPNSEALLRTRGLGRTAAVITQLIDDLSTTTRPFILVLDDYHLIESADIHQSVSLLIHQLPKTVRLVIVSRTEPPLAIARLRANGDMSLFGPEHLLFDKSDSLIFFQETVGLDLNQADVDLVHQHTEGWIAALNLVAVSLRGMTADRMRRFADMFSGDVPHLDTYLWQEALERIPADLRTFLEQTSILNRFSAGLCTAVTGLDNTTDIIRRCERENLFILPLDDVGSWFRYHHLFADVLRDRLHQSSTQSEIDRLHLGASNWLEANGYLEEAIRHAIAGHDWDRSISLLHGICEYLFHQDHVVELRTWLEGIPTDVLGRSPKLSFWFAWALGRTGKWDDGRRILRVAEQAWASTDDPLGAASILLWHSTCALHAQDNQKCITYGQQALETFGDQRPIEYFMTLMTMGIARVHGGQPERAEQLYSELRRVTDKPGYEWLGSMETVHSAAGLIQLGRLGEANVLCSRASRRAGDVPTEIWMQGGFCFLGEIHIEWNLLADARAYFERADKLGELTKALPWRSRAWTGMARTSWAAGDHQRALDEIEIAIDFGVKLGTSQKTNEARAVQARFWLKSNQLGLARRWAESSGLDPFLTPEYERQIEHLTWVRLLIAERRTDLALPILQRIKQVVTENGRTGELVELSILEAIAFKSIDDIGAASESLAVALAVGRSANYLGSFLFDGDVLGSLLRIASTKGNFREYAQHILTTWNGAPDIAPPDQRGSLEPLSDRELEVLRLVSAGLPNRDIGQRLFISDKTVKKHLSNILGKLESSNRTQAVDNARRAGLLVTSSGWVRESGSLKG